MMSGSVAPATPAETVSSSARRPRILAFAHGCAPGKGSEAGVGWAWAQMLATIGPTWVIARSWPGDREALEAALTAVPEDRRPTIIWVPIPAWTRLYRRGASTRMQRLEYLLWQAAALGTARALHRRVRFDLVWHLTWANAWIGSVGCLVGPPFVYGPLGGGVTPPWRLVAGLGTRAMFTEVLRVVVRGAARYLNPLARLSWQRAKLILVQNPETKAWFPRGARARTIVFPNAVIESVSRRDPRRPQELPRTALFAGRLVAWKGAWLAIRAVAMLDDWRLVVCGDGPDLPRLRHLAEQLGVAERVEFRGHVPRDELLETMAREADGLLLPSLRDEGSWVTAEAQAAGVPVVCLDVGGPAVLAGGGVAPSDATTTAARLAHALRGTIGRTPEPPFATDIESRRAALERALAGARLLPARVQAADG